MLVKISLVSFRWAGTGLATHIVLYKKTGCQLQPGFWLLLRLPGHANHKPLPVTDQDGGRRLCTQTALLLL